jgi:hypothetical protein
VNTPLTSSAACGFTRGNFSRTLPAPALSGLAAQASTYNFEPALLLLEIGGLLASAARTRESAA